MPIVAWSTDWQSKYLKINAPESPAQIGTDKIKIPLKRFRQTNEVSVMLILG